MKYLLFIFILFLCSDVLCVNLHPIIVASECKYKKVSASTTDTSGGITVPNGETYAVYNLQANGADPSAYVALIWDYQGAGEKIILS